jgi:phosphohistidine phosphatase SixA
MEAPQPVAVRAVLIRHGAAGDHAHWRGDDRLRPLTGKGRRQAAALPGLLAGTGIARVVSSPFRRCVETAEPLAEAIGVDVEISDALAEGADAAGVLEILAQTEQVVAVCTHGDVCHLLVGPRHTRKGAAWVLEVTGEAVRPVQEIPPSEL